MASPQEPGKRGVWAVGVKTVTIDGLRTEVWYPVRSADIEGATQAQYDFRRLLPPAEAAKIPDDDNPWLSCDCVRDAPLDEQHGPYPVIVFVHHTAGFRYQSLSIVTHWVSHGFVVIAADHPGRFLGDIVAQHPACGGAPAVLPSVSTNIDSELAALANPSGELGFLAGHVDPSRVALAGLGSGADEAAKAAVKVGVRAVVAMAGYTAVDASTAEAAMFLNNGTSGFDVWNASIARSWSIGYEDEIGSAAFTVQCSTKNGNSDPQTFLEVLVEHGVCEVEWAWCRDWLPEVSRSVNDLSSLMLRSTLQCQDIGNHLDRSEIRNRTGLRYILVPGD